MPCRLGALPGHEGLPAKADFGVTASVENLLS
jgi:hypothetical protein